MTLQLTAIVFDMDGVLVDAKDWHFEALNDALNIFGEAISPEEHAAKFDGLPTRVKLKILEQEGRIPPGLFEIIESTKQARTLRAAARLCFPRLGHLIMMAELQRRGYKIGVATNSIRASASAMLGFAGVLDFIDILLTNEDVTNGKPDPEIYLSTCAALGALPKETLVVDDNHYGIAAATAAGCNVLQVESPSELSLSLIDRFISGQSA